VPFDNLLYYITDSSRKDEQRDIVFIEKTEEAVAALSEKQEGKIRDIETIFCTRFDFLFICSQK
jgi:hypothetical protein